MSFSAFILFVRIKPNMANEEAFDYSLFGDILIRGTTGEEAVPVKVLKNKVVCNFSVSTKRTSRLILNDAM